MSNQYNNFKQYGQDVLAILFHFSRYVVACFVTTISVALLPIAMVVILAVLCTVFLLFVWLAFLFGAPLDGGALQAIFWFIGAPLLLLAATLLSIVLIALFSSIFVAVSVLPISVAVEFICRQDSYSMTSTIKRLAIFLIAGLAQGIIISSIIGFMNTQLDTGARAILMGVIFLTSGTAVFLSGLILTLMATIVHAIATGLRPKVALQTAP